MKSEAKAPEVMVSSFFVCKFNQKQLNIMPRKVKTLTEIAEEYGVHINTLRRWISPIKDKLQMKGKILLLPWQVKMIYEFLDRPDD